MIDGIWKYYWLTLKKDGSATIIDVRGAEEYAEGHLKGAINIPVEEMAGRVSEIPEGPVFVQCGTGARSEVAYDTMKDKIKGLKYLNMHVKIDPDGSYEITD